MRLGYNTNGLPHHRLTDSIDLVADEGFQSIALTLDAGALDPYDDRSTLVRQVATVGKLLDRRQLGRVVETGARFLLNPRVKHDPTLMDPDPARRAIRTDFLIRSINLANELHADAVSFWSGRLPDSIGEDAAMSRLAQALRPVLDHAESTGMRLAFEPEPGMFIDTFDRFRRLDEQIRHPLFDLTLDVGHVHCLRDGTIADRVLEWGGRIANIHIEDMREDVHDHLMFGDGTIDFPPIFHALNRAGYRGGVHVELSRHGHMAAEAVRASAAFLKPLVDRRDGNRD